MCTYLINELYTVINLNWINNELNNDTIVSLEFEFLSHLKIFIIDLAIVMFVTVKLLYKALWK